MNYVLFYKYKDMELLIFYVDVDFVWDRDFLKFIFGILYKFGGLFVDWCSKK